MELKEEDYSRAQIESVKFLPPCSRTHETCLSLICWEGREITEKRAARAQLLFCLLAALLLFLHAIVPVSRHHRSILSHQSICAVNEEVRMVGQYPARPSCPSNYDQMEFLNGQNYLVYGAKAGSPERVRRAHRALLGSQSEHRVRFISPSRGPSGSIEFSRANYWSPTHSFLGRLRERALRDDGFIGDYKATQKQWPA